MADYLRYVIKNLEPVRVADNASSQLGQTDTLRYIPGSAIRGAIITEVARQGRLLDGSELKKVLFGESFVCTNAYLTTKEHTLIPSPKGFYEDKTVVDGPKDLPVNVVIKGEDVGGNKRAGLGRYCYIDNGCIYYYSVKTGSDLKIKINAEDRDLQSVFRNEYMSADQYFEGYVRLSGTEADEVAKKLLAEGEIIILGNGRSAGLGKCQVILSTIIHEIPSPAVSFDAEGECYMMLLSNTVMRNEWGECCGLNLKALETALGVSRLENKFCSTSVKEVKGYNRTWRTNVPSVLAYEAGSVFHFTYEGTITAAAMESVMDHGIGIRKNEGFGRVLFLQNYEEVHQKLGCDYIYSKEKEKTQVELTVEEEETLKITAANYYRILLDQKAQQYIISHPIKKGGLKSSKLGSIEALLNKYRYQPSEALKSLKDYFVHAIEKEKSQNVQKDCASILLIKNQITEIMQADLSDTLQMDSALKVSGKVMGFPLDELISKEEESLRKLQLVIDMLKFDHKKEV